MSSPENSADADAFARLDEAVGAVLERLSELQGRVREAEARNGELEELLERFRSGDEDPARMAEILERARDENQDLRDRLERGREAAQRLLARIRFLNEQR